MHLTGGIDVGNGYVKGVIRNAEIELFDKIDLPSAVASTSRTSPKVPIPDADAAAVLSVTDTDGDFYNNLHCTLTTPWSPQATAVSSAVRRSTSVPRNSPNSRFSASTRKSTRN